MTTAPPAPIRQQMAESPRWIAIVLLLFLGAISIYSAVAFAQAPGIRVVGVDKADENAAVHFTAHINGLPVPSSGQSIRPTTGPAVYQQPYELLWDFGDGSTVISSGERPSMSHIYGQQDDYVVQVRMRDPGGKTLAEGSHHISVKNVAPKLVDGIAAIELTGAPRNFELSSRVIDAPEDVLTYSWSFGDGVAKEGIDMWRTNHRWAKDGRYQVILRVDDGDGGKTSSSTWVIVGGAEKGPIDAVAGPEGKAKNEAATSFVGSVSGSINTTFNGHIEPMTGLYLNSIRPGVCRFMMTAWDPTQLANLTLIADMPNLRPGGVSYRFDNPDLYLSFHSSPELYRNEKHLLTGGGKVGAVLSRLSRLTSLLDSTPTEIAEGLGVSPNSAPGHAPDSRRMAAALPFGGAGYSFSGGTLEIAVTTHDRAEGDFNVTLADTRRDYLPLAKGEPSLRSPVTLRGKFTLNLQAARGQGMVRYQDCMTDSFAITSTSPEDDEQHRTLSTAPKVSFDSPYDADTLNETTFQVGYFDTAHEFVPVAGRIIRNDKDATFVPVEPLLDGVRYEARVTTGTRGVRGRNGEPLEDPEALGYHPWTFFTRIGFEGARSENQLACHVFQTVRDAPLVNDKPTVARIYADWRPHAHVSRVDQVTTFDTRASLGDRGASLGAVTTHTFIRPDLHTKSLIKHAKHTANIFGWRPRGREGPQIKAALEVQTTPGNWQAVYQTRCPAEYWNRAPIFRIDYYTVEGLPEPKGSEKSESERNSEVTAAHHGMYQSGELYAMQMFPIHTIRGRSRGSLMIGRSASEEALVALNKGADNAYVNSILIGEVAGSYAKHYNSDTDLILGFIHFDHQQGGRMVEDVWARGPGIAYVGINTKVALKTAYVAAWVHEVGHALGLHHLPDISTRDEQDAWADLASAARRGVSSLKYDGIEGFRIAPNGRSGWNKSSTEGNAESESLAPLMLPAVVGVQHQFIASHHYHRLQHSIDFYTADTHRQHNPFRTAAVAPAGWMLASGTARASEKYVKIGGVMGESDEMIFLGPLTGIPADTRGQKGGEYTLALLDAAGGLLASSVFDIAPPTEGRKARSFSASVRWNDNAKSLALLRGTTVLVRRERTSNAPKFDLKLSESADVTSDNFTLQWFASDADADLLTTTILYSPNGVDEWSTKALWLREQSFTVDTSTLEPGPNPTFRILVSDGFDEVSEQVSVVVTSGLRVLSALPSAEVATYPRDDIALMLNSGLTAGSVSSARVTLREGNQPAVKADVHYEESSRLVRVIPSTALKPGTRYQASLDGSLEDAYGNRLKTPYTWSFSTAEDLE